MCNKIGTESSRSVGSVESGGLDAQRQGNAIQENSDGPRASLQSNRDVDAIETHLTGLTDVTVAILAPRDRDQVDGIINTIKTKLAAIIETCSKEKRSYYELEAANSKLVASIGKSLVSKSADVSVNFETMKSAINKAQEHLDAARDKGIITEAEHGDLGADLQGLSKAFDVYCEPKKDLVINGLINRETLERLGVAGVDIGGIGVNPGFLDVNVEDKTNNPNHLILGDARILQAIFERGSADNVRAELLPLVLMVGEHDTQQARADAIEQVLAGVNHMTDGEGTVSIQFNDNSQEAFVTEGILKELAQKYDFTLKNDNPRSAYRCFTFQRNV